MIIRLRDAAKLLGISVIACCAVFVCTLFLNFNIDIVRVKELISSNKIMAFYDAQVIMGKVTSAVSGGCLFLTSVIMLFFYIKHYIDVHRGELGILKALGYSNLQIAKGFWVFGFSVFLGTTVGFCSSFALMPTFYKVMNEDKILPDIPLHFNLVLVLYLIVLPTIVFALLAVVYSYRKLKTPVLELLNEKTDFTGRKKKPKQHAQSELTFLQDLKQSTVKSRSSLIFFIGFASFCYSDMMQMSFNMNELASPMFTVILIVIGLILACTTLFLAITTVINANTKTISMMRAFGYSLRECSDVILNGYRPVACIGFAIGTVYQYGLLKIMLSIFSKNVENVPKYNFDVQAFIIVLISFAVLYEAIMFCYVARIKKISIKEIMMK
jgi:ABC-type transport system, involved in lipoprotein release, permease component